jgi:hypothetical protein
LEPTPFGTNDLILMIKKFKNLSGVDLAKNKGLLGKVFFTKKLFAFLLKINK